MKRAEKREHLIDTAIDLFNRAGFHAVGIDQVIAESGIAKTTLYRHFRSKDDLIVAVLQRIDAAFRDALRQTVEAAAPDPVARILASFDFLETWFRDKAFYGCPFMGAAGEYGERTSPVFQAALVHKRLMIDYFEDLARAAAHPDPRRFAEEINLLHEGAIAVASRSGRFGTLRPDKALQSGRANQSWGETRSCRNRNCVPNRAGSSTIS